MNNNNNSIELINNQDSLDFDLIKPDNEGFTDARNLHEFLEINKDFSTWIKGNLERVNAIDSEDYFQYSPFRGNSIGITKNRIDYKITSYTAEHISMMSGSKVGKQVRDFYIECRKAIVNRDNQLSSSDDLVDQSIVMANQMLSLANKLKQERLQKEKVQKKLDYKQSIIIEMSKKVPVKTMRQVINQIVRAMEGYYQDRWHLLYEEFKIRYSVDIPTRARNRDMKKLDYAEQNGYLENLYLLALNIFEVKDKQELQVLK